MNLPPPVFRLTLRVYWEDTDAAGVVFHANYLKFFERARTEWLRSLGVSQETLRVQAHALFVVADTQVRYRRAARLDDSLEVTVAVRSAGRASLVVLQQALREGELLAEGDVRIGCVDAKTFRLHRIPNDILEKIL